MLLFPVSSKDIENERGQGKVERKVYMKVRFFSVIIMKRKLNILRLGKQIPSGRFFSFSFSFLSFQQNILP